MKLIQKSVLLLTLFGVGFLPFFVAAAVPPNDPEGPITTEEGLYDVLEKIVGIVRVIFFILAGLFLVFAAFKYLTSGGDEDKVKGAKNALIYAIVAIVVALIATGIVAFVRNILTTP